MAEELLAIHETVNLLNDDDVLELFKGIAEEPADERWMNFGRSSKTHSNSASNLKLISVALNGKGVDLSKVISVIDETVTLLKEGAW